MGRKGKRYYLEHRLLPEMLCGGDRETLEKAAGFTYYGHIVKELNRKDPEKKIAPKDESFPVTEGRPVSFT